MPKAQNKIQEEKELLEAVSMQTKKLAVLLHHLKAPEKVKQAWATLLPKMSTKQISELLDILEARYLDEQTQHIDKEFKQKIADLVNDFEKKKKENSQKLQAAIKKH